MPAGRPSIYSAEIVDRLCERLALGESLRTICDDDAMPGMTTVFRWLQDKPEFREQYARAREVQADTLFDELLDIADDGRNDWMEYKSEGGSVGYKENGEALRRSALRIDTRKWIASKLQPKKYGERSTVAHEGGDKPIGVTGDGITDIDLARRIAFILSNASKEDE